MSAIWWKSRCLQFSVFKISWRFM